MSTTIELIAENSMFSPIITFFLVSLFMYQWTSKDNCWKHPKTKEKEKWRSLFNQFGLSSLAIDRCLSCWSIGMKALKDCRWDHWHSILWRVRGGLDCHPETGSGYPGIQAAQRSERNGSWHALPSQLPKWRGPLCYS